VARRRSFGSGVKAEGLDTPPCFTIGLSRRVDDRPRLQRNPLGLLRFPRINWSQDRQSGENPWTLFHLRCCRLRHRALAACSTSVSQANGQILNWMRLAAAALFQIEEVHENCRRPHHLSSRLSRVPVAGAVETCRALGLNCSRLSLSRMKSSNAAHAGGKVWPQAGRVHVNAIQVLTLMRAARFYPNSTPRSLNR